MKTVVQNVPHVRQFSHTLDAHSTRILWKILHLSLHEGHVSFARPGVSLWIRDTDARMRPGVPIIQTSFVSLR